MDILSKLPFLSHKTEIDGPAVEDQDHEARSDRIQFHRDHVRNGPVNFKHVTNGMVRRANDRELRRSTKRARRAQLKNYFSQQRLAAIVRGHLQLSGALPYVVDRTLDPHRQIISTAWLVQRFGTEVIDDEGEPTGRISFEHDDVLVALGQALHYYGQIVGLPNLQLPEDYVVPVYLADAPAEIETAGAAL